MELRQAAGLTIAYCGFGDVRRVDADVVLAKVGPTDAGRIEYLRECGFHFHDRTVLGTIALRGFGGGIYDRVRADVEVVDAIDDDILPLAHGAFPSDRRFHLRSEFDQALANKVLDAYIARFSSDRIVVFRSLYRGELVGFTIVRDMGDSTCENVLGAVDPFYQSRGVAFGLYVLMLRHLKEQGYEDLRGRISTANMASINLHIALGAKYGQPEDDYIRWN